MLATVVILVLLLSLFLTLIGLPGNWMMVVAVAAYATWGAPPDAARPWLYPGIALALAVIGEIIEFTASAAGLSKGGSRRGALLAIAGAFIGSIVGGFVGLPIPVLGSVIGIIFCSCLGAMLGAMVGELWKGRRLGHSLSVGKAAFTGRLVGVGVKLGCGGLILLVFIAELLL